MPDESWSWFRPSGGCAPTPGRAARPVAAWLARAGRRPLAAGLGLARGPRSQDDRADRPRLPAGARPDLPLNRTPDAADRRRTGGAGRLPPPRLPY